MDVKIYDVVFMGEGFPIIDSLLVGSEGSSLELLKELMQSGHFTVDGLDISKFLREDLSINLEKLELAVHIVVEAMEKAWEDDPTIAIFNLEKYFELRNIQENEASKREEKTFILGFVSAVAMEASTRDTLIVRYREVK